MAQQNQTTAVTVNPITNLRRLLSTDLVKQQLANALEKNAEAFQASLIDLVLADRALQECEMGLVIAEAMKAAVLDLPLVKTLGQAYVVPFKEKGKPKPTFILGYKGMVQLALRTGLYRHINAGPVYEGEFKGFDKLSGEPDLSGIPLEDGGVIGYFAFLEFINGYRKTIYWTNEQIIDHGKRHSKSFNHEKMPWQTNFPGMAKKTLLRELLTKWGAMSIKMASGLASDGESAWQNDEDDPPIEAEFTVDGETGEVKTKDAVDSPTQGDPPKGNPPETQGEQTQQPHPNQVDPESKAGVKMPGKLF